MKKGLRKILRRTAWVLAGILVFLIILHIPPVRNLIKGFITGTVSRSAGGELRIEGLGYNLLKREATVTNVEFEMPGLQARVDQASISFSLRHGISLTSNKVEIELQSKQLPEKESPPDNIPSTKPWMHLKKINSVNVDDTRFVIARIISRIKEPKNSPKMLTAKLNKPTSSMLVATANPKATPKIIPSKGAKK